MSQITDYMNYTLEQKQAQGAAQDFRKNPEKICTFLCKKRQELRPEDRNKLRNARFDERREMLIGKNGYRLEWRVRPDPDKPINDETNPQFPHGVAVLTKPMPSLDTCILCQKRPGIKTDSNGKLICYKCASYAGDPVKRQVEPSRNAPCHCGSGKKYKHCHMPRPGIEAEKLIQKTQGESRIIIPGERRRPSSGAIMASAVLGALAAASPGILIMPDD